MNTFEITVQRKAGDGWPVVVEQSRPGVFLPVRGEGILPLDLVELRSQATARDYGTVLGRALFRDGVARAFDRARAESEDRLHVLLFVEAPDLKALHWERLCAPLDLGDHWDFLARDQRVPFSLYLPSLTDRRFPAIGRRDLRALVVGASPPGLERYGLAHFDVGQAISGVRTALGGIPCDVLATVEGAIGPPTLDAMCERITAERYTLVHVVCHGQLAGDETVLYLARTDGRVDPVAGTRLLERLRGLRGARGLPHFAFLATCESASPKAEGALGGLAQRLVRELGMPAVLAMTEPVSLETAQALAGVFYRYLWEHGDVDRALVEACAGLAERRDSTVPALYSRLGGRPLFSDALDRALTDAEIEFGLGRVRDLLGERAPVLCAELDGREAPLRGTLGRDPAALSRAVRDERKQALEEVNTLCEDGLELSFNAVALGQEPPPYDPRCPFRGLYPFRAEDREFFFGREALVETLRQKVAEHPFLAVLGPSGSGKSSLVLAGLLPALQAREPDLQAAYLTPGATPLVQLEASLVGAGERPFVLIVDQFEEVFTLCPDEAERRAFLGRLLELATRTRVVVTMRADFWGACAPYPALKEAMRARQELIAAMDAAELRRAIELQAQRVGLRFEADLANTILDDVRGEPGAMPLLQHALLELWSRRHGRWLRAAEYWAIGGVRQAIARTADDVYEALSPEDQGRVRQVFARLTRLGEETVPGEERRDTRQRVRLDELVPVGSDPAAARALVRRLADARLVVLGLDRVAEREEVEVAHEALIRHWPRLRDWLDEDRAGLRLQAGIRQAALEWADAGQDESLLVHRGSRLADAIALCQQPRFALNAGERAYLDACVALREREQAEEEEQRRRELEAARERAELAEARQQAEEDARHHAEQRAAEQLRAAGRERRLRSVAMMVAALMVVVTVFAVSQQWLAATLRVQAEQQERLATSRNLAAQALARLDDRPDLAFLLGLQANRIADTVETRGSLLYGAAAKPGLVAYLRGHPSSVNAVAFSPDGTTLASGGDDATLILWDVATRRRRGELAVAHTETLRSLAFSPDGAMLAAGGADRTIVLWDVASGAEIRRLPEGHSRAVTAVAFSRDGATLASGGEDGALALWDVTGRRLLDRFPDRHPGGVTGVAFSPDGATLASGGEDGTVVLSTLATPSRPGSRLERRYAEAVKSVAFSPDGATLAAGSVDRTVVLWDVAGRRPRPPSLTGLNGGVWSVAFSPDGRTLVSSSGDNTVSLWDVDARRPLGPPLTGHSSRVWSAAFSPDGRTLASGSRDGTVILWDVALRQPLAGHTDWVQDVAFSPDGATLASAGRDNTVIRWDAATRRPLGPPLEGHTGSVNSVAFSPDGATLASGGWDKTVILWDAAGGAEIGRLPEHEAHVAGLAFRPDGRTLAAGVGNNTVVLWDLAERPPRGQPLRHHTEALRDVAFSPDGTLLATAGDDWNLVLREVAGGGLPRHALHDDTVAGVAFSPDGTMLASAGWDATIRLWEAATGRPLGPPLRGHADSVNSVAFSPDGAMLASGSADRTVILWDVATRRQLGLPLRGHTDWVFRVAFSPDGSTLASASRDSTIMLWSVGLEPWSARVCRVVGRNLTEEEWRQFVGEHTPYALTCPELPPGANAAAR